MDWTQYSITWGKITDTQGILGQKVIKMNHFKASLDGIVLKFTTDFQVSQIRNGIFSQWNRR